MEIKAELLNPTTKEREAFIVEQNHRNGYEIREYTTEETQQETIIDEETEEEREIEVTEIINHLEAWGYTEEEIEEQKREEFFKEFFNTSLGWVRRKVSMKTGETKDFLADILPILQVGIPILTYTIDGEQNKVLVTEEFIEECKQQVFNDFYKKGKEGIDEDTTDTETDI